MPENNTGQFLTPSDYIQIVKKRKWGLILPFVLVFFIAAVIALLMPSYYKSVATILIEEQEIPADFVMATVTSYAEQRLQSINQRIMSSTRLLDIINQFNLYPDLKDKWSTEEIIEKMKEDIHFETISADVIDRRTGRPTTATIAFTLSFEGKSPQKVQRVASTLTSFFLEENLRLRERQTQEASQFLEEEKNKLEVQLNEIDEKISQFKEKHINELPELLQVNLQSSHLIDQQVNRLNEQMRSLKEREGYLETQLASLSPETELEANKRRLEELKMQLLSMTSKFSDAYPDVIKLKSEIKELEIRIVENRKKANAGIGRPENPAYITIASQLASTRGEIGSVKRQIADVLKKQQVYQNRIAATPKIESIYSTMLAEKENLKAKYDDLTRKMMEAQVAQGLEKDQKGERFTLIDPPRLPEKPFKPNRIAIILMGLILGIGVGVAFIAVAEFTDDTIRNPMALSMETALPVLAGIPFIEAKKDLIMKKKKRFYIACGVLGLAVLGLVIFHFFVMDLYIFWIKLARKLSMAV